MSRSALIVRGVTIYAGVSALIAGVDMILERRFGCGWSLFAVGGALCANVFLDIAAEKAVAKSLNNLAQHVVALNDAVFNIHGIIERQRLVVAD